MTSIPKIAREGEFSLSFAQQRLWFLDQMEPGSPLYNMPSAVKLTGTLDAVALEQSLNEIVRRHEALRTTFAEVEGQPVQVIADAVVLSLPVTDLCDTPVEAREELALQLAHEEAERPFDLAQGPLVRAQLLRLDEAEHLLILNMHHIVTDSWSMGVFINELAALYEAFANGSPSPMAELPVQYADFADWHAKWLKGDVLDEQLAYWKQQLGGNLPVLQLPTDRPKAAVQTFNGAVHRFVLPKQLVDASTALGQQEGATLFMTLLAAFKTLLYRYTGQEDVLVGTPVANRTHGELEGLIGYFVNTLVLRTDLSGNPTFRELMKRVREVSTGANEHQDLPFEKLVEELQPERLRSHSPLFQVMFVYEEASLQAKQVSGLSMVPVEIANDTSKFDLTLFLVEGEDGLCASFEYNTDLFDAATIVRMQGHLETLLEGMLQNPDEAIGSLPLLRDEEKTQLAEWNDTATDFADLVSGANELCIHQLFEAQVERTPDSVALVCEDEQVTYRELNVRANQVAHHLQKRGLQPDGLVGICIERSVEMVVGLLGILKAGGAYVPMDPDLPQDRIAYLLEDTQVALVLTHDRLLDRVKQLGRMEVISLDGDWQGIAQEDVGNVESGVTADKLAYVIYTSGSTGKPKGVMVPHRGVCNRLLWMQERYQLSAEERFMQKTPFGFDVSVYEFFSPLIVGARLVISRPGGHQDPGYLLKLIAEQQITIVHFVPSMLGVFLEERGLEECTRSLRMVICSGEALPYELQERFNARMRAGVTLHNFYGPTEASIEVTYWDCQRESALRFVPMGKPIANCQMQILNQQLQQMPIGVPGELHIGGIPVARGYLNRPDLTEEKFIHDPFRAEEGARLYKTGDLGRYLPDGTIQYMGRIDHQVKIRGFRIELGEIEVPLALHPTVREAVVTVLEDVPGYKRLVAYVVPENGQVPASAELRGYLKDLLPDYMVPSAYVTLEALPLSSNGKVDRKALPVPDLSSFDRETVYVAPRTPLEEVVAMIWEEVLGVEVVGVCDNFFELGGYSLLGIQVLARIREAFEIDLPVRHLFEARTVEGLSAVLLEEEGQQTRVERTAELLLRMLRMSDEEAEAMLTNRNGG